MTRARCGVAAFPVSISPERRTPSFLRGVGAYANDMKGDDFDLLLRVSRDSFVLT